MNSHHEAALPVPAQPPVPTGPEVPGQPVREVDWFRRMPTGGTVYTAPVD